MAFNIGTFRGAMPRVDPRLLDEKNAVRAVNCKYDHGNLESLNGSFLLPEIVKPKTKTLFRYLDSHWFSWNEEVNAVNSPIPKDPHQRVYFTGLDAPRYTKQDIAIGATLPNASLLLGVPRPESRPTVSVLNARTTEEGGEGENEEIVDVSDDETRFYVYTWVTDLGEEGPPSDPSNKIVLDKPTEQSVRVVLPTLPVNDRNITRRRIYRTATSGDMTDFYLVDEVAVTLGVYTDRKLSEDLSVPLVTENYFPPPSTMKGLTALPNGVLIGFDGNVLCPSEPNLPYAYNPNNQLVCDDDVVAIGALPSGAVIATKGQPYLLQGFTPDSYSLIKLESSAPCVSSRSLVDMGAFVVYASSEGLVMVSGGEPQLVTRSLMTKEQWQEWMPETIHAYQHGDKYVAFSEVGAFILDPNEPDITEVSIEATAGCRIPAREALVLANNDTLSEFDPVTGSPLSITWLSKEFKTKPTCMSAAKVVGTGVTATLLRDGVRVHSRQVEGETVFRLPSGYGSTWQIEIAGAGAVETISFGNSMAELM